MEQVSCEPSARQPPAQFVAFEMERRRRGQCEKVEDASGACADHKVDDDDDYTLRTKLNERKPQQLAAESAAAAAAVASCSMWPSLGEILTAINDVDRDYDENGNRVRCGSQTSNESDGEMPALTTPSDSHSEPARSSGPNSELELEPCEANTAMRVGESESERGSETELPALESVSGESESESESESDSSAGQEEEENEKERRDENGGWRSGGRVCREFAQNGVCLFGQLCRFEHATACATESPDVNHVVSRQHRVVPPQTTSARSHSAAPNQTHTLESKPHAKRASASAVAAAASASSASSSPYIRRAEEEEEREERASSSLSSRNPCVFFQVGRCTQGLKCQFAHVRTSSSLNPSSSLCTICYEPPQTSTNRRFGLLEHCSHVFCYDCIMEWRRPQQDDSDAQITARLSCPVCRTPTSYVMPSLRFAQGDDKRKLWEARREQHSITPCWHYERDGECPFGARCRYWHRGEDVRERKNRSVGRARMVNGEVRRVMRVSEMRAELDRQAMEREREEQRRARQFVQLVTTMQDDSREADVEAVVDESAAGDSGDDGEDTRGERVYYREAGRRSASRSRQELLRVNRQLALGSIVHDPNSAAGAPGCMCPECVTASSEEEQAQMQQQQQQQQRERAVADWDDVGVGEENDSSLASRRGGESPPPLEPIDSASSVSDCDEVVLEMLERVIARRARSGSSRGSSSSSTNINSAAPAANELNDVTRGDGGGGGGGCVHGSEANASSRKTGGGGGGGGSSNRPSRGGARVGQEINTSGGTGQRGSGRRRRASRGRTRSFPTGRRVVA